MNQGFRAREAGSWREYEYIFPLSMIGGNIDGFSSQISKFVGSHSFHNFHRVQRKNLVMKSYDTSDDEDDLDDTEDEDDQVSVQPQVGNERFTSTNTAGERDICSVFSGWKPENRVINKRTIRNMYCCKGTINNCVY